MSERVRDFTFRRANAESDEYTSFWKTVERYGGQKKMADRLVDIESIWSAYLKPYPKSLIWELAKSPYTVDQIETMAKYGHRAMFALSPTEHSI